MLFYLRRAQGSLLCSFKVERIKKTCFSQPLSTDLVGMTGTCDGPTLIPETAHTRRGVVELGVVLIIYHYLRFHQK